METNRTLENILQDGGVILYPTDTIRGIGCDATNEAAVERVFEIKKRPKEKSMIVLMSSQEMLAEYGVELTPEHKAFLSEAKKPVTMILSGVQRLAANAYHADGTVGVRIVNASADNSNPGADRCHNLIKAFGKPIISSSANISDQPSPALFEEISADITEQVDGCAPADIIKIPGEPSQIVRIDTSGEVDILRA